MNSLAFEAKKAEVAKLILLEDNEAVVDRVMAYLKDKAAPCQFTVEELKAEVEKSVIQHQNGQTRTQEDVFDKIEKLLAE